MLRAPCQFSEFNVTGEPIYISVPVLGLDLYKWHADTLLHPSFDIGGRG